MTTSTTTTTQKTMRMSPLSHALSTIATEVFVKLDEPIFRACRPVELRPLGKARRSPNEISESYATWKPKDSLFFTLIKSEGDTVVFCHANGTAYYAAPAVRLASGCPLHTAFLCQWCLDREKGDSKVPRLLVFDILENPECPNVAERGERLRALARCLPQPMCVVQWSGHPSALDGFVRGLPHPVECIMSLSENPLKLYRHLSVDIPQPPPGSDAPVVQMLLVT